jgi:heterodisulfide reductase subunit A-like polyferredoxin
MSRRELMKPVNASISIWMATTATPDFPALQGEVEAEVCVIGAGIAGVTTAYLLAREGRSVVLVDARRDR